MFTQKTLAIVLLVSSSITLSMEHEKNNEQHNSFVQDSQPPAYTYITMPSVTLPLPLVPYELPKRIMWAGGAVVNIGISDHATRYTLSTLSHAKTCPECPYLTSTYLLAAAGAGLGGAGAGAVLLCAKKAYYGSSATIKKKKATLGIGKVASGAIIFALSTHLNSLDDSSATTTLVRGGQFIGLACATDGIYDIYESVDK